jgi:low temperature requirement protein LtrA
MPPPTASDAGLQPERTRLAWRRTTLAITVVALLAVRMAVVTVGGPVGWTVAAVALLGWVAALWLTQRRIAAMATSRPAAVGRVLWMTALTILGYAVLGTLLLVLALAHSQSI